VVPVDRRNPVRLHHCWVLRAEQGIFSALSVTPTGLLTVLGFSTATAVAAKGITVTYISSGRVTKPPSPASAPAASTPAAEAGAAAGAAADPPAGGAAPAGSIARGGILLDDSGRPELAKIQMVGFTILTIGIFLATRPGEDQRIQPGEDQRIRRRPGTAEGNGRSVEEEPGAWSLYRRFQPAPDDRWLG
jgi:hypothetical protein